MTSRTSPSTPALINTRAAFTSLTCLARRIQAILLAVALGSLLAPWALATPSGCSTTYLISAVPQQLPEAHYRDWSPLVKRLESDTGLCFHLHVPLSIQDFGDHLLVGKPDFIFAGPYHMLRARQTLGYIPLVRSSEAPLIGILVTRSDHPITDLKELNGKTIAFPAPQSFAACMLLRPILEREGVKYTPVYLNSHEAVYRAVVMGDVAAGGGIKATLAHEPEPVQRALITVRTTQPTVPHPFAAHPRVPASVRKAVSDALLAMATDASGQDMLRRVGLAMPVAADYARDYQPLETMKLEIPQPAGPLSRP